MEGGREAGVALMTLPLPGGLPMQPSSQPQLLGIGPSPSTWPQRLAVLPAAVIADRKEAIWARVPKFVTVISSPLPTRQIRIGVIWYFVSDGDEMAENHIPHSIWITWFYDTFYDVTWDAILAVSQIT
jgi:hypothetical protein